MMGGTFLGSEMQWSASPGSDGVTIGKHTHLQEPIDPDRETPPVKDVDATLLDALAVRRMPNVATTRVRGVTCPYTMLLAKIS
ncbi:hypothetical protein [Chelativorans sp.]|uniref:hypothetical protein n=1 Tax=Chelativorans sp. TaxID=2203393 RepID=UPI0028122A23|nr:hypothetical protein [Chelativorans sp.]